MEIIFINSNKRERKIGEANTESECFDKIDLFLSEHNYKSYYKRTWSECGVTMVDVGSWSEFFKIIC